MARGSKCHRRFSSRQQRASPYPMPSCSCRPSVEEEAKQKKACKGMEISEKREWEYAICSVCMEFPHNAVLLLCSSHDKGCRPYMCGTSYRYSNCLDQFKKAYTKVGSGQEQGGFGSAQELACPLCRGQVKGWTVVEAARKYLNAKKRSCMQDECSFVGTYKELREHVRAEHACARPHQVDPLLRQKWRTLEHERDREDVISTIRSSAPGAMILGDYVIERGDAFDSDDDNYVAGAERDWLNLLFFFQAIGGGNSANVSFRRVDGRRNGPIIIDDNGTAGADAPVALSDHGDDNAYPPSIRQGRSQMRRRRLRHISQPRSLADLT